MEKSLELSFDYDRWRADMIAKKYERSIHPDDAAATNEGWVCSQCRAALFVDGYTKDGDYHVVLVCPDCRKAVEF